MVSDDVLRSEERLASQLTTAMSAHASPLFEAGGDQRSQYRSSILALQMVVSTALLPLAAARARATEAVALGEALAVSIVWGALRVTWLDVALLWVWNLVGHAMIALLGMRSFAPL